MKLSLPFFKSKQEGPNYYLSLLLSDDKILAIILEEHLSKVKIIGQHERSLTKSIEDISLEELIDAVDKAVTRAEEVLPPQIETHQTVFGVKANWIEEDTKKIKKEYLAKLKKVCDSLDLTPLGFMVTTEAILNLLQEEEGAPVSAILAEITEKNVTLNLCRGGKITETVNHAVTESIPNTIDNLMLNFTAEVLPARIILLPNDGAEKLTQQLLHHQWNKTLPFLHVPQINPLTTDTSAKALTFGAATQMGFEVLGETAKSENAEKSISETKHESKPQHLQTDNFGFVVGEDIAQIKDLPKSLAKEEETVNLKEPISGDEDYKINLHQEESGENDFENTDEERMEKQEMSGKKLPLIFSLPNLPSVFAKIRLPENLPNFSKFFKNKGPFPFLAIGGVILLLFLLLTFIYFYKTRATVVLSITPKEVTQSEDVTFSSQASTDFSSNTIAAKDISTTIDGSDSTGATGKKDVGNKAKGNVTIFNNSSNTQTLSSGTEIKSSNGLLFTLDSDVSVSSASGDVFSGTKPGTASVNVTAEDIGTDSNLPSGTKFTIGSNSDVAAKNDNAFSGGTKKTVTVVGKDDVAKLKNDLPNNLSQQAKDSLSQKISSSEKILPIFSDITLTKTNFDKNVGDEANSVKITSSVVFSTMSYQQDDLDSFVKSLLKSKYSQDINFASNSLKIDIQNAKQKSNTEITSTLNINAGLLPKIDTDSLIKKIQNQSLSDAKKTLNGVPQIAKSVVTFSPNIPLLPELFPRLPKNIVIQILSND